MLILKRLFNQFTFLAIIQDTCTQYFLQHKLCGVPLCPLITYPASAV